MFMCISFMLENISFVAAFIYKFFIIDKEKGKFLVAASVDNKMMIVDLNNKNVPPRLFSWVGKLVLDLIFINDNEFYSVG